ncbi:MAG: right-handed parallel beta-helix repeat-containing protein, partial [Planctomycetota bacterium]|nr:right-handed parallel beta-helix repeat-containing protein [Planctomycetota bacterium]
MFKPCCTVAVVCVTLSGTAFADIINVPGDYRTIQEAIDAAMDGDEVEVHPGTYFETIDFLGKAITVRSSNGPAVTIIDASGILCGGDGNSDCCVANGTPDCDDPECEANVCEINPACCLAWDELCAQIANKLCAVCSEKQGAVSCINGEGSTTILDGFTITGAICSGMYNNNTNPTVTNCTFSGNTAFGGGGMYNVSSSPTVTNCTFSGNTAFGGGGGGMYNDFSSPTVTNCTFDDNTASAGAGMFNFDTSSPAISHCQFINNTTSGNGAGGGMINSTNSSPTISDCTFSGNFGGGPGGGMGNGFGSSPIVTNCTFNNNTTAFSGGGIFNFTDCSPNVTNCIFTQNTATFLGGGIYNLLNSNPVVTNCSFSANSAIDAGGIYNLLNSSPMVSNCIFWDDSPAEIVDADGSISTVRYTDIQGGWTGAGSNNIDADPLF